MAYPHTGFTMRRAIAYTAWMAMSVSVMGQSQSMAEIARPVITVVVAMATMYAGMINHPASPVTVANGFVAWRSCVMRLASATFQTMMASVSARWIGASSCLMPSRQWEGT